VRRRLRSVLLELGRRCARRGRSDLAIRCFRQAEALREPAAPPVVYAARAATRGAARAVSGSR
jgi:hypothetical protein